MDLTPRSSLLVIFSIILTLGTISCEMDSCKPPFAFGSGAIDVADKGPIKTGQNFYFGISMFATSISELKNIEIIVTLPNEVVISKIEQLEGGPDVVQNNQILIWKGDIKYSFFRSQLGRQTEKRFRLRLKSKTDWEKWSSPIEVRVSAEFSGHIICPNYPNGLYTKTTKWSHDGYFDPANWDVAPNGYRGDWKK